MTDNYHQPEAGDKIEVVIDGHIEPGEIVAFYTHDGSALCRVDGEDHPLNPDMHEDFCPGGGAMTMDGHWRYV